MGCIVSKLFWICIYFLYLQGPLARLVVGPTCSSMFRRGQRTPFSFRCAHVRVEAVPQWWDVHGAGHVHDVSV